MPTIQLPSRTLTPKGQPSHVSQSEYCAKAGRSVAQHGDREALELVQSVARARGVVVSQIFQVRRGKLPIALARQIAMYLMHIMLGRSLTNVGVFFDRDRTTIAYACAKIEDMRDEPSFDDEIAAFEEAIAESIEHRVRALQVSMKSGIAHAH